MMKTTNENISLCLQHLTVVSSNHRPTNEQANLAIQELSELLKQRDELLVTLKRALNDFKTSNWTGNTYDVIEQLIKKIEGHGK